MKKVLFRLVLLQCGFSDATTNASLSGFNQISKLPFMTASLSATTPPTSNSSHHLLSSPSAQPSHRLSKTI